MYRESSVTVVVPAFNEETLLSKTLTGIPEFVDTIMVVNDGSTDRTQEEIEIARRQDARIHMISHERNGGVGAAIRSGYQWAREHGADITVVMAGDNQMDPADLPSLLDPIIDGRADYIKGNRFLTGEAWRNIPHSRYLGGMLLSILTKVASGYWHIADSQCGYTAITAKALAFMPLDSMYPSYGVPNDILVSLNIVNLRVLDVPVKAVYNIGEKSGINPGKIIFSLPWLLVLLFGKRMIQKYIIRNFHPLVLLYALGILLFALDIPVLLRLAGLWALNGRIPPINALSFVFITVVAFQAVLFAMLFDMEDNRHLQGD